VTIIIDDTSLRHNSGCIVSLQTVRIYENSAEFRLSVVLETCTVDINCLTITSPVANKTRRHNSRSQFVIVFIYYGRPM